MFLEILAGSSFSGNEQCEFLERIDTADPRKWLSAVCAYANSEGGLLFVGAKDNRITGLDRKSAHDQNSLVNKLITSSLCPSVDFETQFLRFESDGSERFVLEIRVRKSYVRPVILTLDGIPSIYVRRDGYSEGASYDEIIAMSISSSTVGYDTLPAEKHIDSEGFRGLEDFILSLTQAKKPPDRKKLIDLGIADLTGRLTNAGLMFSDGYSGERTGIVLSVFSGYRADAEKTVTENEYSADIASVITYAVQFVKQRMNSSLKRVDGVLQRVQAYPADALLDAVCTAFMTRDYNLSQRKIRIDMFRDRLEITSPGLCELGSEKTYDLEELDLKIRNSLVEKVLGEALGKDWKPFGRIVSSYEGSDGRHRPYVIAGPESLKMVLPDLTNPEGVRDSGIPKIEFMPVKSGSRYDRAILEFCYDRARKAGEIASYLDISDSTYFRKQVLTTLEKCDYLESEKVSRTKYYRTNPDAVMLL